MAGEYMIKRDGKRVIIGGDNAKSDFLGKYLLVLIHEATYKDKSKYLHTSAKTLGQLLKNIRI